MATTVTQLSTLVKVEPAAISSPKPSSNTPPLANMNGLNRPSPFKEEAVPLAKLSFQPIDRCVYTPKYLGSSDQEALGCECGEEWGMQEPSPLSACYGRAYPKTSLVLTSAR